jgi:hypothetical protein
MRAGIIGTGDMARALGARWAAADTGAAGAVTALIDDLTWVRPLDPADAP